MMKILRGIILLITTLIFTYSSVFADCYIPVSGDPSDPAYDVSDCPLDTWVYLLVIAAVIFGAYQIHKKHKAVSA